MMRPAHFPTGIACAAPPAAKALLSLCLAAWLFGGPSPNAAADDFIPIDIDAFVAEQRPMTQGTTSLLPPSPVRFVARLKQYPQPRKVEYLYQVLEFFPMDPRPEVNHRMFVTTPGGHILPVYVDDRAVEGIRDDLKEEGAEASFYGYHMYNYAKGPAILVTGFQR